MKCLIEKVPVALCFPCWSSRHNSLSLACYRYGTISDAIQIQWNRGRMCLLFLNLLLLVDHVVAWGEIWIMNSINTLFRLTCQFNPIPPATIRLNWICATCSRFYVHNTMFNWKRSLLMYWTCQNQSLDGNWNSTLDSFGCHAIHHQERP